MSLVDNLITFYANADCGCCTIEMRFKDEESIIEAFTQAGLGNGISIVDDAGDIHTGIDTFYGFWQEKETSRSLSYLVDKLGEHFNGNENEA